MLQIITFQNCNKKPVYNSYNCENAKRTVIDLVTSIYKIPLYKIQIKSQMGKHIDPGTSKYCLRFYVPLKNFSLKYGDVTITGDGLQNLGLLLGSQGL
jgi:hypothetical protein